MSVRRPRRAVVVLAGSRRMSDRPARGLVNRLGELGVETTYLGREQSAPRIAAVVVQERADAVELCLDGPGGVVLLRELLRELIQRGRREVSIVVHRATPHTDVGDEVGESRSNEGTRKE